MDTYNSQESRSSFKKNYEGTEDQIADLAITLHSFLKVWKKQHPNYEYSLTINYNQLELTVKNINNESNTSV